jgi:hypothetical protein
MDAVTHKLMAFEDMSDNAPDNWSRWIKIRKAAGTEDHMNEGFVEKSQEKSDFVKLCARGNRGVK